MGGVIDLSLKLTFRRGISVVGVNKCSLPSSREGCMREDDATRDASRLIHDSP